LTYSLAVDMLKSNIAYRDVQLNQVPYLTKYRTAYRI